MTLEKRFEKDTGAEMFPPTDYPSTEMMNGYEMSYWKEYVKWLKALVTSLEAENEEYLKPVMEQQKERIQELEANEILNNINAEALAEIKAVVDGCSKQSIKDIVYGCLAEIENKPHSLENPKEETQRD